MENWRIDRLLKLEQEDPTDDFVIYAIGQEYLKSDDFARAIIYFEKLKKQNPEYVGLYYHLAAAYSEMGEISVAVQAYEEGIIIAQNLNDLHSLAELQNAKLNLELEL